MGWRCCAERRGSARLRNTRRSESGVRGTAPASALTTKTFRITEQQHRALKIRSARSDDPSEKDISAIVRKALDRYLASDLKNL